MCPVHAISQKNIIWYSCNLLLNLKFIRFDTGQLLVFCQIAADPLTSNIQLDPIFVESFLL